MATFYDATVFGDLKEDLRIGKLVEQLFLDELEENQELANEMVLDMHWSQIPNSGNTRLRFTQYLNRWAANTYGITLVWHSPSAGYSFYGVVNLEKFTFFKLCYV